jgi:hypothetical protein
MNAQVNKCLPGVRRGRWLRAIPAGLILMACGAAPALAQETRSYVVSFFAQQFSNEEGDCPGGINPEDERGQTAVILKTMGHSDAEVRQLMATWDKGREGKDKVEEILTRRAIIEGEPVNPMTHPEAVPDPGLKFVQSKYAFGFNLDGKAGPNDFVDPQTRETGVDHQLFRALGCNMNFRGSWTSPSAYGEWVWVQLRDSQPAWLITLTGADLSRDGEVTIRIERALEHLRANLNGTPRSHMTYRADPDPRSINEFRGVIKDGTLLVKGDKDFSILWNGLSAPVLNLKNLHLRLTLQPNDTLDGLIAGYQPWRELYFAFSHNGIVGDRPGLWHAMKKAADADPDPATGQNLAISAAYRISAVPAFVVPAERVTTAAR